MSVIKSDDPDLPTESGALADTARPDPGATVPSFPPAHGLDALPDAERADYPTFLPVNPEHYILEREIARGGMGRIRAARDRRLRRTVAVKEILATEGDAALRFEREARITARLQHPSIVNVHEAGMWPSGEPFFAMKLVTGRSLHDVVADAETFEERLALLPNVLAVADAMAYAHAERVIHRDLKPKNVLVGAFGETVVIDWGLAKDLADASSEDGTSLQPFRRDRQDAETVVGDVVGTPAYMPPEQAEGLAVDARADVYAIGAILDHVLSGKPAYSGASSLAIIEAVKSGPPVPLAERQPFVPADLLAIVDRAMSRDPAARYATARELADDLRRFQTGQLVGAHRYSLSQLLRRWLHRHRTALSVAGVAAAVLVVLGVIAIQRIVHAQRLEAEQRVLAEESRRHAEELMTFMLGDLRDKLQPLGRLDLLTDVAEKSVAYYDRRGATLGDDEQFSRAAAGMNLGDTLLKKEADRALAQYRISVDLFGKLAAKEPARESWQRELSVGHTKVGDALLAQGDTARALTEYRTSLAIVEALVTRAPSNADWQARLASNHERIGNVLYAQGDMASALVEYKAFVAISETLATQDPSDARRQARLSIGRNKIGDVLLAQGEVAGALVQYRASLAIAEALRAKDPDNTERQEDLSISHERVGAVLRRQGDAPGALAEFRAAVAIDEALAARDPTNLDRQSNVSIGHYEIADVLRAQGDAAGALAEHRASLAIRERVTLLDPSHAGRQRDLSFSHDAVGDVLFAREDAAGALVAYRAALAIRERLAAKDPSNTDRQRELTLSRDRVGDVLFAQKDVAGALAAYRSSLAIREALAAKDPTNTIRQRDLTISNDRVGDLLVAQKDPAGALAMYRTALAIRETLASQDPTNAKRQYELVVSHNKIGDALLAQNDKAGARAQYSAGLAIAQRLASKDPTNADWKEVAATLAAKVAR